MEKRVTGIAISLLQYGARTVKHRVERQDHTCGEVPEWSNGAVSKTVVLAIVPWVRIPPSPPFPKTSLDIPERQGVFGKTNRLVEPAYQCLHLERNTTKSLSTSSSRLELVTPSPRVCSEDGHQRHVSTPHKRLQRAVNKSFTKNFCDEYGFNRKIVKGLHHERTNHVKDK